ncbi:hypothetical protein [Microcella sp.]|nr:hypothetical protein [Microcella sp.]
MHALPPLGTVDGDRRTAQNGQAYRTGAARAILAGWPADEETS